MYIPHDPVPVDHLSGGHHGAFVITGTLVRLDTLPSVVQIGSLCTDTAIDGREGEVTAEVGAADAAAGVAAGRDVVGVDHAAGAGAGIFP